MVHPSIRAVYRNSVAWIQQGLTASGDRHQVTQSLVELWKFVYRELPKVRVAIVPSYPEYRREWAASLVEVRESVDWKLIDREDREYLRVIEHFADKANDASDVVIDIHDYDVRQGVYWADL